MRTGKYITQIILATFLAWGSAPLMTAQAELIVTDHVIQDRYNYRNTEVSFVVNGKKISSDYPGLILSDGSAVGSFHDIFEVPLGVKTTYYEGCSTFTISYQNTVLTMTLGDCTVLVNGKSRIMPQAPIVYSFNDQAKTYLYVPTRFVAEAFGFQYDWNAALATSTISRAKSMYDGTTAITYSGKNPVFYLNNEECRVPSYPGYVFEEAALLPLPCFTSTGLCQYDYREEEGLLILKKDQTTIRLVLDHPVAYLNDTPKVLPTVPRLLTPLEAENPCIYLPASFILEALGYSVQEESSSHDIRVTVPESFLPSLPGDGSTEGESDGAVGGASSTELSKDTYKKELFSLEALEQLVSYNRKKGYSVPERISAYSCAASDAIYFEGITEEQLNITDKSDLLEIRITGAFNPFGAKLYYEPENSYLTYFGIHKQDSLTITLFKSSELSWYTYNLGDGCVLHLCAAKEKTSDRLGLCKKESGWTADSGKIVLPQSTKELMPAVSGEREAFTVLLPDYITEAEITDEDDYNNQRFILKLPGNLVSYLSAQGVYQPVKSLKSYTYRYNSAENRTYLTFSTSKLQAYRYSLEGNVLSVRIDDPRKLFQKIIVLDAGHGGVDPGTLRGTVYEKNINFNVINLYAASYFKNSDIKVYYTRNTDTKIALETRAALAAKVGADFFISFHVNSNNNPAAKGTSVYYSASNNLPNAAGLTSKMLGSVMLNQLVESLGTKNAGLLTAKFVVIHENTVPAILIESGFITNDSDFAMLTSTSGQKKFAKVIFDVVTEIFDTYPTNR